MKGRKFVPNPTQLPLFTPESAWRCPDPIDWPDFRGSCKVIGLDIESYDPNLLERGPGFIRGDARVVGISLASGDGQKIYLPIGHSQDNVADVRQAINYVRYQLGDPSILYCGANLLYDLEGLHTLGIEVKGKLGDIQVAEPLLDEEKEGGYSLNALAKEYLNETKDELILNEAAAAYGVSPKGGMNIIPARFVAEYAETDAYLPVKIFEKQAESLKKEDCWGVFLMEQRLQKTLLKMRLRGCRLDVLKTEQLNEQFLKDEVLYFSNVQEHRGLGPRINPASAVDVARVLREQGVFDIPVTAKGADSISNEWLEGLDLPFAKAVYAWRRVAKYRGDFIEKFLKEQVKGRLHSNWHSLRNFNEEKGSAFGTRSGRLSATNVNLTQIPARDEEYGSVIRSLFIADEGKVFLKGDESQQEFRWTLDYAVRLRLTGAAEANQRYLDDPRTDFHSMTQALILEKTGRDIGRFMAKTVNLSRLYGAGVNKVSLMLGVTPDEAKTIIEAWNAGLPFVRELEARITKAANERGWVKTISGYKRRFPLWEPADRQAFGYVKPIKDLNKAIKLWGKVKRAYTHKAMNSVIQGSSSSQIKQVLIQLDDENLTCNACIHDEVIGSYETNEEFKRVKWIMENAVETKVPFLADVGVGPNWAETKKITD